jgi:2-isopropylmalate synthase
MEKDILLYDTTLRDGAQTAGVSFTVEDKIKIARRLDDIGIDYIEGGWPAPGNRTDIEFFRRMTQEEMSHAKIVAFGMTRRPRIAADQDPQVRNLLGAGAGTVCIVGKTWDLHVTDALRVSLEQNLSMIEDTVKFLKSHGLEVIFDAEHFFDGLRHNSAYAMATLEAAHRAGADTVVLCDTNGGSLVDQIVAGVEAAEEVVGARLGIHTHNDSELAVANTLAAVSCGVTHVQGTMNGYGERCGNANLCSIIPNLQLKLGKRCLPKRSLSKLYSLSHYVAEVANQVPLEQQPYVGRSAFAHKGGLHVDGVVKRPDTYEHVPPETVGNQRRLLVSHQAGGSAVVFKAKNLEIDLTKESPQTAQILATVKEMEHEGYQFEGADASFELLVRKLMGQHKKKFELEGFRVIVEKYGDQESHSEATVRLTAGGSREYTAAEGDGPVHALDLALRKALDKFYPELSQVKLTDFKVRVIEGTEGTAAKVRVLIESSDGADSWSTVGVDSNIIEASWRALTDSIEYALMARKKGARGDSTPGERRASVE